MQKELNPDLFGEGGGTRSRVIENSASLSSHPLNQLQSQDHKLAEMRGQIQGMAEQMHRLVGQANEFMKTSAIKFDKIGAALVQLEKNDQAISLDNSQKLSQMNHKIGERRSMDLKTQEMIDRHNSVLRSYELRLSQLQKLIGEREQQIVSLTAVLNEAKMEISRLKRL